MNTKNIHKNFSAPLLNWSDHYGRKDLPWQHPKTAYRVWVSEIMLQQTQVQTVIPYFERFLASFPTVQQLADAPEDTVLAHWSGLGYYSRARNAHKTAKIIATDYQGQFPNNLEQLIQLPGIGPSTAAAIASLAFNQPTAILDGNVKRVLTRYFMIDGWPEQKEIKHQLWELANQCMPLTRCADYTQAIMDLGATCCTIKKPACNYCPVQQTCLSFLNKKVELYPFKKVKKELPIKEQQFLLLYKGNEIYLEKRPPVGLWGGLWCLPTLDIAEKPLDYLLRVYKVNCNKVEPLTRFKHTFSHFHLYIRPLAFEIALNSSCVAENTGRWFKPAELTSVGLAKPVNQIIQNFFKSGFTLQKINT